MEKVAIVLLILLLAAYVTSLEQSDVIHRDQAALSASAMKIIKDDSRGDKS